MAFNLKTVSCACLVTLAGVSSSSADTWETTYSKGLVIYNLGNSLTGKLSLVCDPENPEAPPDQGLSAQYSLLIEYNNNWVHGKQVTFSTVTDKQTVPILGGNYFREELAPWTTLITALQKPGEIMVSTGLYSFSITNDRPLKSLCFKTGYL